MRSANITLSLQYVLWPWCGGRFRLTKPCCTCWHALAQLWKLGVEEAKELSDKRNNRAPATSHNPVDLLSRKERQQAAKRHADAGPTVAKPRSESNTPSTQGKGVKAHPQAGNAATTASASSGSRATPIPDAPAPASGSGATGRKALAAASLAAGGVRTTLLPGQQPQQQARPGAERLRRRPLADASPDSTAAKPARNSGPARTGPTAAAAAPRRVSASGGATTPSASNPVVTRPLAQGSTPAMEASTPQGGAAVGALGIATGAATGDSVRVSAEAPRAPWHTGRCWMAGNRLRAVHTALAGVCSASKRHPCADGTSGGDESEQVKCLWHEAQFNTRPLCSLTTNPIIMPLE